VSENGSNGHRQIPHAATQIPSEKIPQILPMFPVCSIIFRIPVFLYTNSLLSRGRPQSKCRRDSGEVPRLYEWWMLLSFNYNLICRLFPTTRTLLYNISGILIYPGSTNPHMIRHHALYSTVTVVFDRSMAGCGTVPTVPSLQHARAALLSYLVRSICDASARVD
jgi:hypothetical protein